ncbi:hypothetical protein E4U44_006791 [Claviceps purpurea]|nr:hypothetical protein E4U44_006791 [Claviceps purpurea]
MDANTIVTPTLARTPASGNPILQRLEANVDARMDTLENRMGIFENRMGFGDWNQNAANQHDYLENQHNQ